MAPPPPEVKVFAKARKLTHLLGTSAHHASGKSGSWIGYWRASTGLSAPLCCAANCGAAGSHGAHVKLARSAARAAALKWRWWCVPCCAKHNPAGTCATFLCKAGTRAVELDVGFGTRLLTWPADLKHLLLR
jgi:hypothetical protein